MFQILTLNEISPKGIERIPHNGFGVDNDIVNPDAILVRSHPIKPEDLGDSLKGIARAGAGTDKICVEECTNRGIPVFNTPGANANSVKELVTLALLISSRGIAPGFKFINELHASNPNAADVNKIVEKEKKRFGGTEIKGKTLGIVGLGAIGSLVADAALSLGMNVAGFDPALSVESAWRLSNRVRRMENLPSLFAKADYVTLHLPLIEQTKDLINAQALAQFKKGAKLLNFARAGIVDHDAVKGALDSGQLSRYVSDFPLSDLMGREDVIFLPHLGASTQEAEENCAVMASEQLVDFLANGNTTNSVNFPSLYLERSGEHRFTFYNRNIPNMLGQVLSDFAEYEINVIDLLNKSRGDYAYSVLDLETAMPQELIDKIKAIDGVISTRVLKGTNKIT